MVLYNSVAPVMKLPLTKAVFDRDVETGSVDIQFSCMIPFKVLVFTEVSVDFYPQSAIDAKAKDAKSARAELATNEADLEFVSLNSHWHIVSCCLLCAHEAGWMRPRYPLLSLANNYALKAHICFCILAPRLWPTPVTRILERRLASHTNELKTLVESTVTNIDRRRAFVLQDLANGEVVTLASDITRIFSENCLDCSAVHKLHHFKNMTAGLVKRIEDMRRQVMPTRGVSAL
jgi:hypothetical protein